LWSQPKLHILVEMAFSSFSSIPYLLAFSTCNFGPGEQGGWDNMMTPFLQKLRARRICSCIEVIGRKARGKETTRKTET
jgi:hypothetical protein